MLKRSMVTSMRTRDLHKSTAYRVVVRTCWTSTTQLPLNALDLAHEGTYVRLEFGIVMDVNFGIQFRLWAMTQ